MSEHEQQEEMMAQEEGGRNVQPATEEDKETILKYDLTKEHAKYMDKHMMLHLLDHMKKKQVYPAAQMEDAELALLAKTKMVDHYKAQYMDYKQCTEEQVPGQFDQQREKILKDLQELQEKCKPLTDVFYPDEEEGVEEEEAASSRQKGWERYIDLVREVGEENRSQFNLNYLNKTYDITKEHFESLYHLAKLKYEIGDYQTAAVYLQFYRRIGDLDNDHDAKWGKLCAEMLWNNWPDAVESMKSIHDAIDSTGAHTPVYTTDGASLQARAWLMHWSLFVFFFYTDDQMMPVDDGLDKLIELWLPDMYKNPQMHSEKEGKHQWKHLRVLQTLCPHLLRYITVAVIVGSEGSGKRASGQESGHIRMKQRMKDLQKLIEAERRYYNDPITEFVRKLLSDCDFEGAHKILHECELAMDSDFFLFDHKARFVKQARMMIFENHCRIHSVMDIGTVAKKLNTDDAGAERYIVKMIRGAQLDAKIDSEANQVLLASQGNGVYRMIREKTKLLRDKTDQLIERLQDRRPQEDRKEEEQAAAAPPPQPNARFGSAPTAPARAGGEGARNFNNLR